MSDSPLIKATGIQHFVIKPSVGSPAGPKFASFSNVIIFEENGHLEKDVWTIYISFILDY